MCRVIPVYLRDEVTQEYRAQVPNQPGRVVRASTLHDLRRKLRAFEADSDEITLDRSGLRPSTPWAWEQPFDPNADTVLYVKV
ncbi:hypothetical protein TA3x_003719 [Tundrisphaera sp. TA3]|uniref:hypothetical protein n=1 Tax=Tundrisphaera sp. TA3 TaxID=3435775 RepID=UPI003EB81F71